MPTIARYWNMSPAEERAFFGKMSTEESRAFFTRYLAERDVRLAELRRQFTEENAASSTTLDFSPTSLIHLWSWASTKLKKREWSEAERPKEAPPPQWSHWDFRPFSDETLLLLNDIAYYFAEVFRRNHLGISWEVCRTEDPDFAEENQPVLAGFFVPMNPRALLRVVAHKTFDQRAGEFALFDLHETWIKNLKNPRA